MVVAKMVEKAKLRSCFATPFSNARKFLEIFLVNQKGGASGD